jgi:hypothetical protein
VTAVEIPETLRLQATAVLRLPPELVDETWRRHCDWIDRNKPGGDYGGLAWQKFTREIVADLKTAEEGKTREERRAADRARNAKRAAEAKADADAEYAKYAVSFREYVEAVQFELFDERKPLPAHEVALARAGMPREGVDAGAWLVDLFAGSGPRPRLQRCDCGREARSWARDGKVYQGARCEPCSTEATRARRAQGEPPSIPQSEVAR